MNEMRKKLRQALYLPHLKEIRAQKSRVVMMSGSSSLRGRVRCDDRWLHIGGQTVGARGK